MYVCPSNVNFINTMIIMKKIIYLVLLSLITGLVAQAHEKTGEWNGCDRYDFTFKDRQATIVVPKKAAKGNPWIWRPAFFDAFPSVDKALLEKGSTLSITTSLIYMEVQEQFLWAPNSMRI